MGRLFQRRLDRPRVYSCRLCQAHLAAGDDLISKSFHCRHGKAYLFTSVINVYKGPCEDRLMTTGLHTVQDIFCTSCQQLVGWKYERAFEKSQKYKEGKFILERAKMNDEKRGLGNAARAPQDALGPDGLDSGSDFCSDDDEEIH